MTAPQQTAKTKAGEASSTPTSYKLQRCWFVTLGLMGGFSFVASQVNFARAEVMLASEYSAGVEAAAGSRAVVGDSSQSDTDFDMAAFEQSSQAGTFVDAPLAPAAATESLTAAPANRPAEAPASAAQPAIEIEITPSAVMAPQVTPVAPPTFTASRKPIATKTVSRGARLAGMFEASAVAAPLSTYVSSVSASGLQNNPQNGSNGALLASTGSAADLGATSAVPALAQGDAAPAPAADPSSAAVPDILPESLAAPAAPAAPQSGPSLEPGAGEDAPIGPTELVPAALPEGTSLPAEYNSVFVDPTDYSVGATESPEVVVSEQSTGCEFTVGQGQAVPDGVCAQNEQSLPAAPAPVAAGTPAPAAPAASAPAPVASAPAVNVGPVSFSASGIRFSGSTTAAGRDYLNRTVRPVVSLQAAEQFIFPLAIPSPITSLFGFRIHPITGDYRFHAGTDIGAPQGTPVLAVQEGTVAAADYAGGYGLMVVLQHESDGVQLESLYAHLSEILVEPGKAVKKGDVIGLVGNTGNSTGPHLHFEMRQLTADGWIPVNADGLVQASLANLVKALNSPMQALSFDLADLNLNLTRNAKVKSGTAVELPPLPGQNGVNFRPAQPNAS